MEIPSFTISPPKQEYEVADVFTLFMDDYRQAYTPSYRQEEVIRAIMACRTPEMGGVVNQCDDCSAVQFVFKSCGNNFCPKCGKFRKAEWVARQEILELPVPYFHVTHSTGSGQALHHRPCHQCFDPGQPEGDAGFNILGSEYDLEKVW